MGGAGKKSGLAIHQPAPKSCRDDPTRTDDPYVPNVVRYQLRYIPMLQYAGV